MKTILFLIIFCLLTILMVGNRTYTTRITQLETELTEYRKNKLLVLKKAKRYHGTLWAWYDTNIEQFYFINKKGIPCKLFRSK